MRRRLAFALAAFTVGALALPATGSAAGGGDYLRFVYFSAPASDGFRLSFTASSGPGKRQPQASFALSRRGQSVTYATKGRPAIHGNHIEGDFGPFGSFSGTFSGNVKGGKGCDPYVHHRTEFEGRLDVEGEHGFASATLRKASGRFVALVKDPDCDGPVPERKPEVKQQQVLLLACPSRTTELFAHLDRRRERSSTQAWSSERRGKVLILRSAVDQGDATDFEVDGDLAEATLSPGGPFDGSAAFADGELTGDLTVDLLGTTEPTALTPAPAGIASGRERPDCGEG